MKTIEDVVRQYVIFKGTSGQGWNTTYCEVCGDGEGRLKGPRGGWRFSDKSAFYHCFNCEINVNFDPEREFPYSKRMRETFQAFGIPEADHKELINNKDVTKDVTNFRRPTDTPRIEVPDHFYLLSSFDNAITRKARDFLWERKIDPDSYPFYLSNGISKMGPRESAIAKSYVDRLIIPSFKGTDMVYYQARMLEDKKGIKYLSPSIPKENIIYGYDKLYNDIDKPLFITEGFFDSYHLDGVAVLGNSMSKNKAEIINRSPRRKIVIPDKKFVKTVGDDGRQLATQAQEMGWDISLPELGRCKDVTEAIQKYGKLYVVDSIIQNIRTGFSAKVALDFF